MYYQLALQLGQLAETSSSSRRYIGLGYYLFLYNWQLLSLFIHCFPENIFVSVLFHLTLVSTWGADVPHSLLAQKIFFEMACHLLVVFA